MIKFIHSADIHLDSPLHRLEAYEGAPTETIRQATRRAFENMIDLALNEAVDFVLIAGDLFDGDWKDYNTGLYFINQVSRLQDSATEVIIVAGNHDAAGRMTRSLPYPPHVHLLSHSKPETVTLPTAGAAIHGMSFANVSVKENLAPRYPTPKDGYFNIGLLHTSLTGRQGHATYAPCTIDDLVNKGYDYWALGHVHQHEIVGSDPPIVYPGCIQGRHVRECGSKGCVLVSITEKDSPQIIHYPLDVVRWERLIIDLNGVTSLSDSLDRFKAALTELQRRHDPLPLITRVEFQGKTNLHGRLAADSVYIKEAVRSTALATFGERVWIEKLRIQTQSPGSTAHDPGPLQEVDLLVKNLLADEESLIAFGNKTLSNLIRKLPPDYRRGDTHGDTHIEPLDPQLLRDMIAKAKALLVKRLTTEGRSQ
jgi:DNA repair exonuclease SbcCD nuclease subunit